MLWQTCSSYVNSLMRYVSPLTGVIEAWPCSHALVNLVFSLVERTQGLASSPSATVQLIGTFFAGPQSPGGAPNEKVAGLGG